MQVGTRWRAWSARRRIFARDGWKYSASPCLRSFGPDCAAPCPVMLRASGASSSPYRCGSGAAPIRKRRWLLDCPLSRAMTTATTPAPSPDGSLDGRSLELGAHDIAVLLQVLDETGEFLFGQARHGEPHPVGPRPFRALDDRGLAGAQELGDLLIARLRDEVDIEVEAVDLHVGRRRGVVARPALEHDAADQARLEQDHQRGRGARISQRAGCETGEELRDARAQIEGEAGLALERALGVDRREQLFHGACRGGAQALVEVDGLGELLAHQVEPTDELLVARQRALDALGVAAAQRPGGMPRQETFDLLVVVRLFAHRVHGQPLSIPAACSSSDNFLRA